MKQWQKTVDTIDSAWLAGKITREEYAEALQLHGVTLEGGNHAINNHIEPGIRYTGSCYIGVVGSEVEYGACRDSIDNIQRRPGDGLPVRVRATKGYEARQTHFNKWINETQHAFMLLLDHDMVFEPDTLERLRNWQMPYVSGAYLRRRIAPIAPVWFDDNPEAQWPFMPATSDPERGKLHKIGASGWGCILVHRDVALAVMELIKGEDLVIEDDMDVWPYDLEGMLKAIRGVNDAKTLKEARSHAVYLKNEFRPLTGKNAPIGSDIRFPYYAKAAGYQLWLDPDVRPAHMLNYQLTPDDFSGIATPEWTNEVFSNTREAWKEENAKWHVRMKELQGEN